jgi:hypothetical protein
MVPALIVQLTQKLNPGKVKAMLTAKEIFVLIQVTLKKDTSMQLMVHANCAELVLLQVNQIQPMDSELNVFLEIQVQLLVMDASITETSLEIAKHVEPIKL